MIALLLGAVSGFCAVFCFLLMIGLMVGAPWTVLLFVPLIIWIVRRHRRDRVKHANQWQLVEAHRAAVAHHKDLKRQQWREPMNVALDAEIALAEVEVERTLRAMYPLAFLHEDPVVIPPPVRTSLDD